MPSPSKRKGNHYERELVHEFEGVGWDAKRAYASNGEALGEDAECDLVIESERMRFTVQAKRRKKIASYIKIPENVDLTMVREDRGETLVVMRLDDFVKMVERDEIGQSVAAYNQALEEIMGFCRRLRQRKDGGPHHKTAARMGD